MIIGVGIEAVEISRFKGALDRFGERLLTRLFTVSEIKWCLSQRRPEVHLSGRFAAKVSLGKALGRQIRFNGVEVRRDEGGRPFFADSGLDGFTVTLSITHDGGVSLAHVVAETR